MKLVSNHRLFEDFFDELNDIDEIDLDDTSIEAELDAASDGCVKFTFIISGIKNKTIDLSLSLVANFDNLFLDMISNLPYCDVPNNKIEYTLNVFDENKRSDASESREINNSIVVIDKSFRNSKSYNTLNMSLKMNWSVNSFTIFERTLRVIINILNRARILAFGKSSKFNNMYIGPADNTNKGSMYPATSINNILSRREMNNANISRVYNLYKLVYNGNKPICKLKDVRNFYTDSTYNEDEIKFLNMYYLYNNNEVKLSKDSNGIITAYIPENKKYKFPRWVDVLKPGDYGYELYMKYSDKLQIIADGTVQASFNKYYNADIIRPLNLFLKYFKHINKLSIEITYSDFITFHDKVMCDLSSVDINEIEVYMRMPSDYTKLYYNDERSVFQMLVEHPEYKLPTFKTGPNTKISFKYPNINKSTFKQVSETVVSNYDHNDAEEYVSDILENLLDNEFFYEDAYGAFDNAVSEEEIRQNLIDNGYCITVCTYISNMLDDSDFASNVNFIMLDDHRDSYHFFIEIHGRFFDAYNYNGVDKLSDLEFVKMYYSEYSEDMLRSFIKYVSRGFFDYQIAMKLANQRDAD